MEEASGAPDENGPASDVGGSAQLSAILTSLCFSVYAFLDANRCMKRDICTGADFGKVSDDRCAEVALFCGVVLLM